MKLLLTLIDWEYPSTRKVPTPELWELYVFFFLLLVQRKVNRSKKLIIA